MKTTIFIFLIGLAVVSAGCDGFVEVTGTVVDAADTPVAGVLVSLRDPGGHPYSGFQTETDTNGFFQTGGAVTPIGFKAVLSIDHEGFQEQATNFAGLGKHDFRIVLSKTNANPAKAH